MEEQRKEINLRGGVKIGTDLFFLWFRFPLDHLCKLKRKTKAVWVHVENWAFRFTMWLTKAPLRVRRKAASSGTHKPFGDPLKVEILRLIPRHCHPEGQWDQGICIVNLGPVLISTSRDGDVRGLQTTVGWWNLQLKWEDPLPWIYTDVEIGIGGM